MSNYREVNKQILIIAGVIIDLGGEDEACRITYGDVAEVTRANSSAQDVVSIVNSPDVTLTIVLFTTDPGHKQLIDMQAARALLPIKTPQPGSLSDLNTGEETAWLNCELVSPGDSVSSRTAQTVSWVFKLSSVARAAL